MEETSNILIVEDDLDVAEMLEAYFRVQGYFVMVANDGEDAVEIGLSRHPDLVILDIRLPDIDGYEVARRFRKNRRTEHIPIIFLTEKRARSDRLQGLELGADDYITKPFDIQELRLRVRNSLQRISQNAINNPVTGFPEGVLVDEKLTECLGRDDWALLSISLDNLDVFRSDYGFVASDDVLRAVSLMVHNAVRNIGSPSDFIGHLTTTQLVIVTNAGVLVNLGERIRTRIEQSLDYFYPLKDRDKAEKLSQRLALTMGGLLPKQGPFEDLEELKTRLFELR
ncbi:MAG: response regulator [Chloroflexi bacterium]|nr:response regulator [Chloroflexota bacterium]